MERTPRITTTSADGVHSRRGADLQTEVRLSFAADHRDGRPFRIDRPVVCPSYRGNGARPAPLLNRVRTASATSTSTDITTAWDSVKPAASAPVPVASSNSSWPRPTSTCGVCSDHRRRVHALRNRNRKRPKWSDGMPPDRQSDGCISPERRDEARPGDLWLLRPLELCWLQYAVGSTHVAHEPLMLVRRPAAATCVRGVG